MPAAQKAPLPVPNRPAAPTRRWLLFVHQLPPTPSNLRVRTWRRLSQMGAVTLKQSVYALPDRPECREDFEWLKAEIEAAGGEAVVLSGNHLEARGDDELIGAFKAARQDDYAALARDVDAVLKRAGTSQRRKQGRAPATARLLDIFRQRRAAIERIDFFGSAGRDRVAAQISQLERTTLRHGTVPDPAGPPNYRNCSWVTRPRPGVDRMSSAWLIRRFIDPAAHFVFAAERDAAPDHAVPFDMFGVEFGHRGGHCTFETLCAVFQVNDAAVTRIAGIVHDIDLNDSKHNAAEAVTVAALIDGLQQAYIDDGALLEQGMTLFESLYRSFARAAEPARPRGVARRRPIRPK